MNHIVKYNKPRAGSGAVSASGAAVALQSLAGLLTEAQLSVILEGYLLKETFDDLFVKESDGNGGYRIKAKYALYSNQYLSCLGNNPDAGTVQLGATTLGGLNNVVAAADEATAAAKVLVREAGSAQWTLANLSDIVGLDTTALATYLSDNHYAKTSDIPSLAGYATREWVQQQGYQPAGDYATNSALNSAVNTLNTAIGAKLDAAIFDDLFVKESDGKGGYRIKARYALYSNQYLSCLGNNPDAGTVALGATTLGGLNNVVAAADEATAAAKVLVREAGASSWTLKNLSDIVGLDTAALATYLSNNHYATQQWVQLQGYLTEHQSLADYAKKTWVEGKGYLTAITKAQVEAVLTGDITTHTHSQYLTSTLAAQTYQPKGDYALTSALNSAVSSLNTAIGAKLDAATFDDLFVKESDGNGGYRIRAKYAFYSNQYISCLGNNPGAGTTTGGGVDLDAVAEYLQQQGYATQAWVQQQGYLTSSALNNYTSTLDSRYVRSSDTRELVWEFGYTTPTHVWGAKGGDGSKAYVFSGEDIRNFANAVCRAGDTMTGVLNIAHNSTNHVIKTQYNTAGDYTNVIYATVDNSRVIFASPVWATVELETAGAAVWRRTAGVAYRIWDSGNDGSDSGLDADLLDGYHEGNFVRSWWTANPGYNCNTYSTRPLISFTYGNNAPFTGAFIDIVTNGYGFMLGTVYDSDAPLYYRRHGISVDGGMGAWQQLARIGDNVASATKLQTARRLWGNSFDGTGDISGNINLTANHSKIGLNISDQANDCPWYGLRLSCAEGWHVMLSGYYGTSLRSAGGMLSLAESGNVGIGTTTPAYKLHVVGDIMADGWVRTTGAHGWYNQTYAGGWYMDNASWIKAYNKPVFVGYMAGEGANSFGVGLRCYHASHTSVEVQGGSYTMGLGCHSDGSWYWWRGTSAGKGYVMQYDGTTWNFTGVLKTSTGMYSDGYMSCLGQNTGSDARLKDIIGDVTLTLDMIADAPAKLFRWRYGEFAGRLAVGSIAQYWQQWLAPVVSKRPDDYLQMDYGVTALTASICLARIVRDGLSEHERRILALETENKALKSKINELERRLAA